MQMRYEIVNARITESDEAPVSVSIYSCDLSNLVDKESVSRACLTSSTVFYANEADHLRASFVNTLNGSVSVMVFLDRIHQS